MFTKGNPTENSVAHDCGESRLTCVDCAERICPKCMVVCTVGNRCAGCSGSKNQKPAISASETLKRQMISAVMLGLAFGWSAWSFGLGGAGLCFAIVFWAAGRVVGQKFRRNDNSLLKVLSFFVGGMYLSSIAAALLSEGLESVPMALLFPSLYTVLMALGFWMGKCGFG